MSAGMNQYHVHLDSPLVTLASFDHPPGEAHVDPPEEGTSYYSINFVERGSFDLQVGERGWRMSPGMLFLTHPEMVFRCRHAEEVPQDVCFSVCYAESFVEDIRRTAGCGRGWASPVARLDNRLAYLRLSLMRLVASRGDAIALETLAGELLAAAANGDGKNRRLYEGRQLAWYAERVEAARRLLEAEYVAAHSLESIARYVGMSPFHFARIFRELTGTPPHRYLLNVRLSRASDYLRQGVSVTDTCFASGFSNLSYFIRLFRRTFGMSPSQFTRRLEKLPLQCGNLPKLP